MSKAKFAILAVPAAVLVAACSTSPSTTTPPPTKSAAAPVAPAAATSAASAPAATSSAPAAGALSGTWNGQYSGAYTGTFKLTWQQNSSTLSGTIDLSTAGTLPIHGTVQGSSNHFGTVGSTAITYSGSASGNSMSGSWQIKGPSGAAGGGPWNAAKS